MESPYQTPNAKMTDELQASCRGCGKKLHNTASICPECGMSQRSRRYKSKVSAGVLAFFVGGLGVHRFYLGQWWGIFYLLLVWTGIPGLISLIEAIVFLVRDQAKWDARYNEGKPAGPNEGAGALIVVVFIVGAFLFVAMLGILAAVAIPAYQDYTSRARVSSALSQVPPIQRQIEDYYLSQGTLPDSNLILNIDDPLLLDNRHALSVSEEGIRIDFSSQSSTLDGKTMIFVPIETSGEIRWDCSLGTLDNQYRPPACRN